MPTLVYLATVLVALEFSRRLFSLYRKKQYKKNQRPTVPESVATPAPNPAVPATPSEPVVKKKRRVWPWVLAVLAIGLIITWFVSPSVRLAVNNTVNKLGETETKVFQEKVSAPQPGDTMTVVAPLNGVFSTPLPKPPPGLVLYLKKSGNIKVKFPDGNIKDVKWGEGIDGTLTPEEKQLCFSSGTEKEEIVVVRWLKE